MKKLTLIGASTVMTLMTGAVVAGAGGQAPALERQTLYLDSYERRTRSAGPVSTRRKLARGTWYVVTVRGTFSYFDPALLRGRQYCGRPERRPQRRSRGRSNGRVFADVETLFALPRGRRAGNCDALPYHWGNFEMTVGRRFSHVEPIGGPRKRPNRRHRYRYLLQGQGRVARFRLRDVYPRDNYGVLTIKVRRATASEVPRSQPPVTVAVPALHASDGLR